jgi:hypothetical protein
LTVFSFCAARFADLMLRGTDRRGKHDIYSVRLLAETV